MSKRAAQEEMAEAFGVTLRTVQNWQRYGYPPAVQQLLDLREGRHPDWPGYRHGPGWIITPAGDKITAQQIAAYTWLHRNMVWQANRCSALEERLRSTQKAQIAANEPATLDRVGRAIMARG
jgi:hypothetical protein